MGVVFDFFSGVANGLRRQPRSCSKASMRASPPLVSSAAGEAITRFCLLLAVVTIGAAAFVAASGPAARPAKTFAQLDLAAPPDQSLDELLATDPDVASRAWKYVVLHHSATAGGSAQSFDTFHRQQRGWQGGLGYHFVIGNGIEQGDGTVVAGPRWYEQTAGAHANSAEYNDYGIGICLVGNFDEKPPTPAQVSAARALIVRLCRQYGIGPQNVVGHNDIRRGGATACPGKLFPLDELRTGL